MTLRIAIKLRGQSVYYAGGGWAGRESALLLDDENEARCIAEALPAVVDLVVLSDAGRVAG